MKRKIIVHNSNTAATTIWNSRFTTDSFVMKLLITYFILSSRSWSIRLLSTVSFWPLVRVCLWELGTPPPPPSSRSPVRSTNGVTLGDSWQKKKCLRCKLISYLVCFWCINLKLVQELFSLTLETKLRYFLVCTMPLVQTKNLEYPTENSIVLLALISNI